MILRKGSSLLSTVLTIAAVSAVGAAGVMTLTGNGLCSLAGSCGDDAPMSAQTVLAADTSNTAGGEKAASCCPLGAMAKKDTAATVTPVASKTSCSDKANCGSSCGDAKIVAAADAAKSICGEKANCGSKCADAKIVAAADTAKGNCSDKHDCCHGCDKGATVMAAADASKSACADKANCGSKCGGAKVVAAADAATNNCADKAGSCGGCDKGVAVMAAADAAQKSCGDKANCGSKCGGGAVIAAASSKLGCDKGACPVSTFAARFASFRTMLASAKADMGECCGQCDGTDCADVCGDACAGDKCNKGEAVPVMASENGAATGHMISGGLVIPAMFYAQENLDRSTLSKTAECGGCSNAKCGEQTASAVR
jgi:hypothetical protein